MIESSSNLPISPKTNVGNLRQRSERAESSRSRGSEENGDRFEPSSELAARESSVQQQPVNSKADEEGSGSSAGEKREPIGSNSEAGRVISQARSQILSNSEAAASAQGNLDQDTVLDLIA